MCHKCCIHKSYFGCRSGYITSCQSEEWCCLIRHLSILLFLNFTGCCITATLVFCCQSNFFCSISAASLLLVPGTLCCRWLGGCVISSSAAPCHKHKNLLQSCYGLWDVSRYALSISHRPGPRCGYSLSKPNLTPNTKDCKGKWRCALVHFC